jgi:tRNA(Ile)-lysidine synthase
MFTAAGISTALAQTLAGGGMGTGASTPPRLCLALSGGLDSTVLLTVLTQVRREQARWGDVALRAVHVDHGLHPDSSRWARHCASLAALHQVPFESVELALQPGRGESVEAAARSARYEALAARLTPGEVLITAHHADDQLETILLQWLRGGGLRAVAGMERMARFGHDAWLARPLLRFTRADIEAWAVDHALQWLEDPSNEAQRFDRNYLRREVLPLVRQRWPAVAHTAGRVAEFARDAIALEADGAAADLGRLRRGRALHLGSLCELAAARQRAALRAWLEELGLPLPSAGTLDALRRDMTHAAGDRIPEVRWAGAVVRRYRGVLHAEPHRQDRWRSPVTAPLEFESSLLRGLAPVQRDDRADRQAFAWIGGSRLEFTAALGVGLSQERLPAQLSVRQREGGETFRPAGAAHRRELRKWLQEHDVLPWRRADLPLLFDTRRRTLIAVADLAYADGFAARPGEPSWRISWHDRGALTESDVVGSNWREHPSFG